MGDMKQEFVQKLVGNLFYKKLLSSKVFIIVHFMAMGVENQLSTDYSLRREWMKREQLVLDKRLVHLSMSDQHICSIFSQLDNDFCQRLFNGRKTKVRVAADNGVHYVN